MAEPEELDEQGFEILEALAKIEDIGDFRLTQFMRERGMNPTQPTTFYRQLIKDSREIKSLIDILEQNIDTDAGVIAKLRADLSAKDQEIKRLRAEKNSLHDGSQQTVDKLEAENRQLRDVASQLQEMAQNYQLLKEFLRGRMHSNTVQVLYHFFYELHMAQLSAEVGRQPPPNSGRLEKIRQKLREEFRDMLHVPKQELEQERDTLQKENRELRERYQGLVDMLKRAYGGGG